MGLWRKVANTFGRQELQRDIEDELAFHLEQKERANLERGMRPEQARNAARQKLGNLTLTNERTADSDIVRWLENITRDVKLALRLLLKSRAFTILECRAPETKQIPLLWISATMSWTQGTVNTARTQPGSSNCPMPRPGNKIGLDYPDRTASLATVSFARKNLLTFRHSQRNGRRMGVAVIRTRYRQPIKSRRCGVCCRNRKRRCPGTGDGGWRKGLVCALYGASLQVHNARKSVL